MSTVKPTQDPERTRSDSMSTRRTLQAPRPRGTRQDPRLRFCFSSKRTETWAGGLDLGEQEAPLPWPMVPAVVGTSQWEEGARPDLELRDPSLLLAEP